MGSDSLAALTEIQHPRSVERTKCYCGGDLRALHSADFAIARCEACGYAFFYLNLSRDEILKLYSGLGRETGYRYSRGKRFTPLVSILRAQVARSRVKNHLPKMLPALSTVLDFGCGQGYYLDALRDSGFACRGVEIVPESAQFARQKGHEVLLDSALYPDSFFDGVLSIHVLEHIPDLDGLLNELRRVLKEGGYFLFEVPNFNSVQARLFRFRWFHTDRGMHFHHFTPASFGALLRSHGFTIVKMEYGSFEQGVMGWLQSILNLVFPYNRFYQMILWNRTTREKLSALTEIVLLPVLVPVAMLFYLVERLLRSGPVLRAEGFLKLQGTVQ